jgi:O-antigen ligase
MKTIINRLNKNRKTSIGGAVMLIATVLVWFGKIDSSTFLMVLGLAGTWIGFSAKDGTNKAE